MNCKILFVLALVLSIHSCGTKDEPASIEADIVSFSIPDSIKLSPIKVGSSFVNAFVQGFSNDTIILAPQITVSTGATIFPASGTEVAFVRNIGDSSAYEAWYNVESENHKNTKSYKVTLVSQVLRKEYLFSFDHWDNVSNGNGTVNYVTPSDRKWATGNPAVAIYLSTKNDPSTYPASSTTAAVSGLAAKMQTISGAVQFGAPIAAGNLFLGIFNSGNLNADKLTFTQFGQPFYQKPKSLKGYYQYKAGSTFTDKNNQPVPGRQDSCFIYGIFYETDDTDLTLDGRNIQTSDRIVAKALLPNYTTPGTDYIPFDIPFIYNREPDFAGKRYKLTIVFTSSKGGALFEGAVGSTLLVDEVTLECYGED